MREFYKCDCGTEMLEVQHSEDDKGGIWISLWQLGRMGYGKMTIKDKIRWIWKVVWTGNPWGDEICLDADTTRKLSRDLQRFTTTKND
jgi:hypothetical protein